MVVRSIAWSVKWLTGHIPTWAGLFKARWANPGLAKFVLDFWAGKPNEFIRKQTWAFGPALNIAMRTFWWRIRLIFRNELVGKFRLNPGLGQSGFEQPGPDQQEHYYSWKTFVPSEISAISTTRQCFFLEAGNVEILVWSPPAAVWIGGTLGSWPRLPWVPGPGSPGCLAQAPLGAWPRLPWVPVYPLKFSLLSVHSKRSLSCRSVNSMSRLF